MNTRRTRAFTVAELVLSLAITALIGASATGVYMVLDTAQADTDLQYERLQTSAAVCREIERTLRPSRLVLACGPLGVALWAGDDNDDGQIALSEIVVFYRAAGSDQLTRVRVEFPDSLSKSVRASLDRTVLLSELGSVFASRRLLLTESPSYAREDVLADDVHTFSQRTDQDAPYTTVLQIKIEIGADRDRVTRYVGGRLRVHDVDRVGTGEAGYVLLD